MLYLHDIYLFFVCQFRVEWSFLGLLYIRQTDICHCNSQEAGRMWCARMSLIIWLVLSVLLKYLELQWFLLALIVMVLFSTLWDYFLSSLHAFDTPSLFRTLRYLSYMVAVTNKKEHELMSDNVEALIKDKVWK